MVRNPNKYSRIIAATICCGLLLFFQPLGLAHDDVTGPARDLLNKGLAAIKEMKYDEAVAYVTEAIRVKPDYARAYNVRGVALYDQKKKKLCKKAIEDFDMAIKLKPDYVSAYKNRGNAEGFIGLYDNDIADQNMALKLAPHDAQAYVDRAWGYQKAKKYDLAIDDSNHALEIKQKYYSAYAVRADAYYGKGEYDAAIKDYNQCLGLYPNQKGADVYLRRGLAFKAKGQTKEAMDDFQKMTSINPGNKAAQKQVALLGGLSLPKQVLNPFSGYASSDACKEADLSVAGTPWEKGASSANGPLSVANLGQYEALLRHTMQDLRMFYGRMSKDGENTFNSFWAPFFDFPNKAALDYFQQIVPLLDQMLVAVNELDKEVPGLGAAMQDVIVSADPSSASAIIAEAKYKKVKSARALIDELAGRIHSLGNPPNPLAARCAAHTRHQKALQGDEGIWGLLNKIKYAGIKTGQSTVGGDVVAIGDNNVPESELHWKDTTFTYSSKTPHFDNVCNSSYINGAGHAVWPDQHLFEASGELSKDGMTIINFHGVSTSHKCFYPGAANQEVKEFIKKFDYDNPALVLYQQKPVDDTERIRLVYANVRSLDLTGKTFPDGALVVEFSNFLRVEEACDWVEIANKIAAAAQLKPADGSDSSEPKEKVVMAPGVETSKKNSSSKPAPVDPANDPKVIDESVAEHMAMAKQIQMNADRWAADADKETDPSRKNELLKRAQEISANAQSERDIAKSLRTGTIVHTPTEWDQTQHEALINSAKAEVAMVASEDKLLASIPQVADMVSGAQGGDLRQGLQQRISEAINSPDRLQKLSSIYSELKDTVVNQGQQQMASEDEKVKMWDRRIEAAEDVESSAGTAVTLATLWSPSTMGSLALGYSGVGGYVEDGVKGATMAVIRGVSTEADAVMSAYEGATKIDPDTGKPGGAWGAVSGALKSIGTNVVMGALTHGLENAKAELAAAHQEANVNRAPENVARAGEGRIKEYDFKTPEERYQAELNNAQTPEAKDAVNKKYAIQEQRQKMSAQMEAAKQKAEEAIHKGEDSQSAKEQYNKDLSEITEKYKKDEKRLQEHLEVMKELGFEATEPTPEMKEKGIDNRDIKPTGSNPETAASDMDFTPQGVTSHESYQKGKAYVEAMKERGHSIDEYGDRWVDNTTDSTVWKPGFGQDKPGSSSFDAEVIFGTLPHSDKFGTKGGVEWTSSSNHTTDDPLGAVLANAGKAAGAGLGNGHPKDLHTIGKSAVKAAEAAKITIADPQLKAQVEGLKAHKTPEQAGVFELGDDAATKEKKTQVFLDKVQSLMGQAYETAKATSENNAGKIAPSPQDASANANKIRSQLMAYKAGNDAALSTIAQASPGLGKVMASGLKPPELIAGASMGHNDAAAGDLAHELTSDRQSAAKAEAGAVNGSDQAFDGLVVRCQQGVKIVQEKLSQAKPGSDAALYLKELLDALAGASKNPAAAVRDVRGLTGDELPAVLAQLGVLSKK
ncbi:MAG: tetratricopeptide repeat protein [Candidatus Omnitrophica bacterium]|nr:tetratricopeptide repeat protein [Candidatus Omnitrophota bacterium]